VIFFGSSKSRSPFFDPRDFRGCQGILAVDGLNLGSCWDVAGHYGYMGFSYGLIILILDYKMD